MSIKHYPTKIKSDEGTSQEWGYLPAVANAGTGQKTSQDIFLVILIVLVAFASFGLGRLSVSSQTPSAGVAFEPATAALAQSPGSQTASAAKVSDTPQAAHASGSVVASKSGTKYHFPWCSGALRIKEENKIWFATTDEAKKAGYTPASNCKGLN